MIGAKPALLALEDGTLFWGNNIGAEGETFGEFVFNTGMTGYQEVLTDPSYCGQIVVMTYPEIGIYGVNPEDVESGTVQVAGFVVHRAARGVYNHRATLSFLDYLAQANIVAIEGVDTRALTRHLRTHGAQRGAISTTDMDPESLIARVRESPQMAGRALAQFVSTDLTDFNGLKPAGHTHIVVVDCGLKGNIKRELEMRGANVTLVPYDAELDAVLALKPDGVLVSNGPGDPEPLHATIALMRGLLERRVPLAGICLGHQLLGLALGGATYKMRFGHRGANHPVKDFTTGRILITTQNHGFAVDPESLGIAWTPLERESGIMNHESRIGESANHVSRITHHASRITMAERLPKEILVGESPLGFGPVEVTQLSLNDGTLEGLRLRDYPAFSVQHHPEACPGPHDAKGFFEEFLALVHGDFTAEIAENAEF
ncbi:MAG: glutamine-hydrolyzing carbamoyl-phosphate synthase small subunit [Anaerolineae bacterium]